MVLPRSPPTLLPLRAVKDSGADAEELAECWELIQERMKRAQEVEERERLMFERETIRRKEEAESQERELERLRLQLKIAEAKGASDLGTENAEIQAGARVTMRDLLQPYKDSQEEGPILETDNVRSPSPENDEGASQVSDEEGGLEIVEDGNSSDGEQGEDESNGAKENDDGGDEAGDGDEAEGVEEEGEEEKPEVQPQVEEEESLQMNPQEEETGSLPVEDTPASPTEEDSSFMHDAPASPPAEESPSSPLEATPSPPAPVDGPASPTKDVIPGASPIESGEDSSAAVSSEEVPADEQSAEVSGEGEDGQENDEKGIADINEGDEEDTQDNASSPKEIESPEAEPEEEEGEELEDSSLAAGGPSDDIASPAPEESKGLKRQMMGVSSWATSLILKIYLLLKKKAFLKIPVMAWRIYRSLVAQMAWWTILKLLSGSRRSLGDKSQRTVNAQCIRSGRQSTRKKLVSIGSTGVNGGRTAIMRTVKKEPYHACIEVPEPASDSFPQRAKWDPNHIYIAVLLQVPFRFTSRFPFRFLARVTLRLPLRFRASRRFQASSQSHRGLPSTIFEPIGTTIARQSQQE
ncbi:hypothetical protein HPB51_029047 [Rhipicephalus microplus]|uniref:Uncharacterized protein n=1 Tax=Rhipicephalus microplus TaxID=6941 RepID=A0A9J6CVC5_RHIMP|nr:hypothetical protein HPB51_029047 [Rhipicephalus microplus]